jgi:hypothetical protein
MSDNSTAELRDIAEQAAKEAVRETLLSLGIDVSDPIAAQKDFMVLREVGKLVMDPEFRKDMEHLRTWRIAVKEVKSKGLLTLVGLIVTGLAGFVVVGAKAWLERGGH